MNIQEKIKCYGRINVVVFLLAVLAYIIGLNSCAIYTKEELDAAEKRTNEERVKFSEKKFNENASKFRRNYFISTNQDSAASREDNVYKRDELESRKAAKSLQEVKQDEDDIRALCCKHE